MPINAFLDDLWTGNGIGGVGNCGFSLYSDGVRTYRVPFVNDGQLPQIVTINGQYVDNGQLLKLNTLDDLTIGWYDESAALISDSEPVTAHEYATLVTVTRNGASRQYSHKTGIPVVDLLYYRDDSGSIVYFDGDYTIPLTVSSPVTFGYSLTNGNVSGAVILEFEQALLENKKNTVTIPAFTDDWGNSVPLLARQTELIYGELQGYDTEVTDMWLFDNPIDGDAGDFSVSSGAYVQTGDIIDDDGDFTIGVTAERLPQAESSTYFKKGATFNISGTQQTRFLKTRTGNEGWFLPEHCIIINMITPSLFSSDFEYAIMMNDFNTRVLQLRTSGSGIQFGDKATYATQTIPKGVPQTVLVGRDSGGNYQIRSSGGTSLTKAGFAGYPASDMAIGYKFNSLTKTCNAIIHEVAVLPYFPDSTQISEIYARSIERWFTEPTLDGNTITADGLVEVTADGLITQTTF